jgi:LIVCS family branched-chain amino acid:cation transporter
MAGSRALICSADESGACRGDAATRDFDACEFKIFHHSWTLGEVPAEELLQRIAEKVLGPFGAWFAAASVFLACLTTAISLAAVFSRYLREDLLQGRVSHGVSLGITLGVTAFFAMLGFSGIVKLWSPVLEVLYPALIVLCLFNIAYKLYEVKPIQAPVFFTLGFAIGGYCFG